MHAAKTPAVELLPPDCPPEPTETGKFESPSFTTTSPSPTPIVSAAVCAMIV
jgi:hypothetical protein